MQQITLKEFKGVVKKTHKLLVDEERNLPMMIWGPMGVGKSAAVKQAAKEEGIKCIDVRLTLLNAVDLRGLPTIDRDNGVAVWMSSGFLPNEKRDGKEGILFLDEINLAPMTVMNADYQLILDREIGDYKLPPGWSVIAAGNRAEDTNNLTKMPNPLLNRFVHYEIQKPDSEEWMHWAIQNDISDKIVAFVHKFPQYLLKVPTNAEKSFPSPRSWEFASNLMRINEPVDAAIGGGVGAEFRAFCEVYSRVPDIQRILKGEKELVPTQKELDVCWATSMAIVTAAQPKHWANVYKYIIQMPVEHQALIMSLIKTKSDEWFKEISVSAEFKEFTKKHPALFRRDDGEE